MEKAKAFKGLYSLKRTRMGVLECESGVFWGGFCYKEGLFGGNKGTRAEVDVGEDLQKFRVGEFFRKLRE